MQAPELGVYLRELRQRAGISVREASRRSGVSNPYLSQIETGKRHPGTEVLNKLAPVYGVTVRELLEMSGHLVETAPFVAVEEDLERAYQFVLTDPRFRFGARPRNELGTESKKFIVYMYQTLTGRKLL